MAAPNKSGHFCHLMEGFLWALKESHLVVCHSQEHTLDIEIEQEQQQKQDQHAKQRK